MTESKDVGVNDTLAQALLDHTPRELYVRAVRAEAAYERAHQQCNAALNEAARLQRERDEAWITAERLREEADEHAALDAETDAGIEQIKLERGEQKRRADSLERALRRLSFAAQATGGTAGPDQGLQDAIAEAERSLTNQPTAGEPDAQDGERVCDRHDPIPALPGEKGRRYLCKDSDGQFYYLNYARTWQSCPDPFLQRGYERGRADERERCARVADKMETYLSQDAARANVSLAQSAHEACVATAGAVADAIRQGGNDE